MFGLKNDFYDPNRAFTKGVLLRYNTWARCIAPLISGVIIDKTRSLWLCLLIFGSIAIFVAAIRNSIDETVKQEIMFGELESFGNYSLLTCQVVMLSKWFRAAWGRPVAFATFFTLMPLIVFAVFISYWRFMLPNLENETW